MNIEEISINRLVPVYLMSSYLYYKKDESKLTDGEFDMLCKRMLENWKDIKHPHKKLIKKKDLEAGTGYAIRKYPSIVMSSAERWLKGEYDD
tara:strand:- start:241 stop:516 length:276 start_codon:yes stop_codon:yes gene_type:complete